MALSRSLAPLALLVGASGARIKQRAGTGTMAGVHVHNDRADAKEWIVLFKSGTTDAQIDAFCEGKCKFQGHPDKQGAAFADVVGGRTEVEAIVAKHKDQIELVEPDSTDYMIPEIEDAEPAASASWGLDRVGNSARGSAGAGVNIYVQDTGIRYSHNDFGGRAVPGIDMTSGDLQVCGSDTSCALDRQGHGTHCAGTAAGSTFGVASDANLLAVKTLGDNGSGSRSWQMVAIDWVTANGARPAVISMSLGGNGADPSYTASIGAATDAGVVVVVAGGNSNSDACNFSPAFVETAITVGSTDDRDRRSSFSNYGTCTNIWAPGSSIRSASHSSDTGSKSLSGTSMACPHVSGAAALLLEQDPTLKSPAILSSLLKNAVWNGITGLKTGDTNALLYVGAGGPPETQPPPPGSCPWHGCLFGCGGENCQYCERCQ